MSVFSRIFNYLAGEQLAQLKRDAEQGGRDVQLAASNSRDASRYVSQASTNAIITSSNVVQLADEALAIMDRTRQNREQARTHLS